MLYFQKNDYEKNKEHFRAIGQSQNPHTLFIGCSDSRLVPTLITNMLPVGVTGLVGDDPAQLWQIYMQLVEIEHAFRAGGE